MLNPLILLYTKIKLIKVITMDMIGTSGIRERIMDDKLEMDIKEYLLDLYEIELHKKSLYENGIGTNTPKPNRENEFEITVKHIAILNELLDSLKE